MNKKLLILTVVAVAAVVALFLYSSFLLKQDPELIEQIPNTDANKTE
jgi:hypothetical protein